jgi:hypothetical protein
MLSKGLRCFEFWEKEKGLRCGIPILNQNQMKAQI